MLYDVLIAGAGPAGLSAALALGRARKRVLLCDFGPRRNQAAEHIHNFVTRDGTPPDEFRAVARAQLAAYPNVELRAAALAAIGGGRGAFEVELAGERVRARRVLLCTGLIDELPALPGFRALWGRSIFQCPYCHGWEVQGLRWAYLAPGLEPLQHFPFILRAWTRHVVVLTAGAFEVPVELRARLDAAGIVLDSRPVLGLAADGGKLRHVDMASGEPLACDVLFAHPPQRQVDVVQSLGLALDEQGCVRVDPMTRETSLPGVFAAGDLTTRMQGAVFAAAGGMHAAVMINAELTSELAEAEVASERSGA